MTDYVIRFDSRRDVRAFNMLAGFFSDADARDALREAGITKQDLLSLTKLEAIQLAIKVAQLGFQPIVNWKRDRGFERTFAIFTDIKRPTAATTVDEFGNTVPVMADVPGVFLFYRHNGDEPINRMNFVRNLLGATMQWRSDNTDGPPDEQGNPTVDPLPEWFPRIG